MCLLFKEEHIVVVMVKICKRHCVCVCVFDANFICQPGEALVPSSLVRHYSRCHCEGIL
jgi:hypothetical protein